MSTGHFALRMEAGLVARAQRVLQEHPEAARVLAPSSDALVPSSFLLLVVRPGAPSSVLAPSNGFSAWTRHETR